MVLREVEDSSPDSVSGSFGYPDDGEGSPVSSKWTVETVRAITANSPTYPNPFWPIPIYARILGWSQRKRDETVVANLNRTQAFFDRRLTPVEVQAETYYQSHFYEYIYKSEAMGIASFIGLAALRTAGGRPGFVTPYARKYLGPTLGDWYIRLSRYGVYAFFGRLQGQIIGALLGGTRMRDMAKRDPNIKDLRKDLAEFLTLAEDEIKRRMERRKAGGLKEALVPTPEEVRRHLHSAEQTETGGFESDYGSQDASTRLDSNAISSSPFRSRERATTHPTSTSTADDTLSTLFPDSNTSSAAGGRSTSSNPGESTWDRIRRIQHQEQSQSSAIGVPAAENPPRVPKSDSFTFSSTDRDRQLAQEEAQREFDARLEKERRGERGWGTSVR